MRHYTKRRPSWRDAARRAGYHAWRVEDEARRLALPPRQADPMPGEMVYRISIEVMGGGVHTIIASWPVDKGQRRPRSDQFAVADDGELSPGLEGKTALLARVAAYMPRMMSRAARDEVDRLTSPAHDQR